MVVQTQCGANFFILDSRRVLAPATKVPGPKHISIPDFVPRGIAILGVIYGRVVVRGDGKARDCSHGRATSKGSHGRVLLRAAMVVLHLRAARVHQRSTTCSVPDCVLRLPTQDGQRS